MTKRPLSMTPANFERRERRLFALADREHREFQAEVMRLVKEKGMDFDAAWVSAGGDIPIPLSVVGVG